MATEFKHERTIDPFFENAINQVFLQPTNNLFFMDGSIGLGKSSNFLMWGAYQLAQCVNPVKKHNKLVRESLWAGIRESENSAKDTFIQLLDGAIFTPEITSHKQSPIEEIGSHPKTIRIAHELADGTFLDMRIACYGFNNPKGFNRLKTREYLGGLVPEMQGIDWLIIKTLIERTGRWRTNNLKLSKKIDGKVHTLTGIQQLGITLADVNIPERPHYLYDDYYDLPDTSAVPYLAITPPEPLIYKQVKDIPKHKRKALMKKYPVTRFEGKQVIWFPNKACYGMLRHFEERDDDDNPIPWTGYNLLYRELHRTDSEVRRYVLGRPDTVGGAASVYKTFSKNKDTVKERKYESNRDVYIGFDPGKYASYKFVQHMADNTIHYHHEIDFVPNDGVRTQMQFEGFVLPYILENLEGFTIYFVPDPAAYEGTGTADSPMNLIRDSVNENIGDLENKHIDIRYSKCIVSNQNTEARINSLGYFIDNAMITVDPSVAMLIKALSGGYRHLILKSGIVSDKIDKNIFSHSAEAAQYPAVNIRHEVKKNHGRENSKTKISKVRRIRR